MTSAVPEHVRRAVEEALTDELRAPRYRGHPNRLRGHCYVASEALYHLLGGRGAGYKPMSVAHEGDSHWFLLAPNGEIVDLTAAQFESPVPYEKARGRGFLTKDPSQRARKVIQRVR